MICTIQYNLTVKKQVIDKFQDYFINIFTRVITDFQENFQQEYIQINDLNLHGIKCTCSDKKNG